MRQASVFTRIALLMMVLATLPACAAFQGKSASATPPLERRLVLVEDAGEACFQYTLNSVQLRGYFRPKGCYSSSASRPLEQTLSVKLDPDRFRIEFHTSFLVESILGPGTADCGGGGLMSFEIGDVEEGVYSIWIGDERVGRLQVPSTDGPEHKCFGED